MRYALTFTKPGTYTYLCIVHGPAMSGALRVHPAGGPLSLSPEEALRTARRQQTASLGAGARALDRLRADQAGQAVRVRIPGDAGKGYSLLRYTKDPLVVRVGTTVTWEVADPFEIHTVTFTGAGKVPLSSPRTPILRPAQAPSEPAGGGADTPQGVRRQRLRELGDPHAPRSSRSPRVQPPVHRTG